MRASGLLIALLVLCAAGDAAADPPAPRASVSLAGGVGADLALDSSGCGAATRALGQLRGSVGQGRFKPAAALGFAVLDPPDVYCNYDYTRGQATAREAQAAVGFAMTTPPESIRLHARVLVGVDVVHIETDVYSEGDPGEPSYSAEDSQILVGPLIEVAAGVVFSGHQYWVGPELVFGYVAADGESLGWRVEPGLQVSVVLAVGVEIY